MDTKVFTKGTEALLFWRTFETLFYTSKVLKMKRVCFWIDIGFFNHNGHKGFHQGHGGATFLVNL
jgi:hypothetical protein